MIRYETNLPEIIKKFLKKPDDQLSHIIDTNNFFIYRNGGCDVNFAFNKFFNKNIQPSSDFTIGSGISFTDEESQIIYSNEYLEILKKVSLLGIWGSFEKENRMLYYQENNIKMIDATCEIIEPYYYFKNEQNILNKILKNKRILIITSHINSVKHQIPFIDKIFYPYKIFENNTFIVLKPPVTYCGKSNNIVDWRDHLNNFYKELDIHKDEFDIALVAAGGYGVFICDYIYTNLKKNPIYIGGALQLFFGIMGNRWKPYFTKEKFIDFPNEYWLEKPLNDDIPKDANKVEDGCYW